MKHVYVLRHADKSFFGGITKKAVEQCKELATHLTQFNIVICSEKERCVETAKAITGREPNRDNRANIENNTGTELVNLITETIHNMRDGENALIISHAPCISSAHLILEPTKTSHSYVYLTGFIVNERLKVKKFK